MNDIRQTEEGYYFCDDHGEWVDSYKNERHPMCNLVSIEKGNCNFGKRKII
jgi:hypothetical protein